MKFAYTTYFVYFVLLLWLIDIERRMQMFSVLMVPCMDLYGNGDNVKIVTFNMNATADATSLSDIHATIGWLEAGF